MRATIKSVLSAGASVAEGSAVTIGRGLCVEVGFHKDDTHEDIEYMIHKILNLRFFRGDRLNCRRNVVEDELEILCVTHRGFFAVVRGNKTTFPHAMDEGDSAHFYEKFLAALHQEYKAGKIKHSTSGTHAEVHYEDDGCAMATVDSRA